ncbi:DUF6527 family protein [Candidatus Spongiihabitans sp.]|uniref:DUF6527 family protein n=1 Tax=Candidatus Spongiihabitans sp. TaxID=3101308 RepID=UPI003C7B0155
MLRWFVALWKPKYKTLWIEDLPDKLSKKTIYIVGGREFPFQAVFLCPKNCEEKIFLNLSEQHHRNERWDITEHTDHSISLHPSVWMKTLKCNCHYWVKKGRIIWVAHSYPFNF